jgi:hypothetical protein
MKVIIITELQSNGQGMQLANSYSEYILPKFAEYFINCFHCEAEKPYQIIHDFELTTDALFDWETTPPLLDGKYPRITTHFLINNPHNYTNKRMKTVVREVLNHSYSSGGMYEHITDDIYTDPVLSKIVIDYEDNDEAVISTNNRFAFQRNCNCRAGRLYAYYYRADSVGDGRDGGLDSSSCVMLDHDDPQLMDKVIADFYDPPASGYYYVTDTNHNMIAEQTVG